VVSKPEEYDSETARGGCAHMGRHPSLVVGDLSTGQLGSWLILGGELADRAVSFDRPVFSLLRDLEKVVLGS
jgi:hypothetical protein